MRGSLPSLQAIPVIFSIVALVPGIAFADLRTYAVVVCAVTACATLWFEQLGPRLLHHGTPDVGDVIALAIGGAVWLLITAWLHRRRQCQRDQMLTQPAD